MTVMNLIFITVDFVFVVFAFFSAIHGTKSVGARQHFTCQGVRAPFSIEGVPGSLIGYGTFRAQRAAANGNLLCEILICLAIQVAST